jgi:hypothetical protein
MITISRQQWDRMGRASFQSRLVRILRDQFPVQTAAFTDATLAAPIPSLVERAHGYGLKDEQSAALFVLNAFLLGPHFDQRIPAIAQILNEPTLSPGTKADALTNFSTMVFHELGQAAAAAGGRA